LNSFYFFLITFLLLFTTGCGNNEETSTKIDNTNQEQESEERTGVFLDSPVLGLHYICTNGREGETKEGGSFTCDTNDTSITFSIPQDIPTHTILLGNSNIKSIITPSDLTDNTSSVLHMIQLLQTLDRDQNVSNGIDINTSLAMQLQSEDIDFTTDNFDTIVKEALNISIVSPEIAYEHYKDTLENVNLPPLIVDHTPPQFTSDDNITILENLQDIITLVAIDNNPLTYMIEDNNTLFKIDSSTGALSFKTFGDYEYSSSYQLLLSASDGTNKIYQTLSITLLDIDENRPQINVSKNITVNENEFTAFDINASDDSSLHYTLSGVDASYFTVNQSSGVVTFKTLSDYESSHSPDYFITVTADDSTTQATSKSIQVTLLPINDNPPLITSSDTITLPENLLTVLRVTATDPDNGGSQQEELLFSIKDGDSALFDINKTTGLLSFKNAPDYEEHKHNYTLYLIASDTNFSTQQLLNITITDIDENAPLFTTSDTNITVDENQLSVMQISATDENSILYSLTLGDSNKFMIDETTGVISFKNLFDADYETTKKFSFSVIASDGHNSAIQEITLNIHNLNDNAPTISGASSESLSIYENNKDIISYTIIDLDHDNLTVTLDNDLFEFNTTNNLLSFKNAPDYENDSHLYNLQISVSDTLYNTTKDIEITLLNQIDTPPKIDNFSVTIDENIVIGTAIGSVGIISQGDAAIDSFRLSGTGANDFTINSFGEIITNAEIDYETLLNHTYDLTVIANNDAGDSESKRVTITVNDINEKEIPLLVIVMNWSDYSESDALLWHNKIFNTEQSSAAKWYKEATDGEINFTPIRETSGTVDDGVIMVNMGRNHPGGGDAVNFRDVHIKNAITSSEVVDSVDFRAFDRDGNGDLDVSEIQLIFIVAGGEESNGDPQSHSIWAHAWAFNSGSTLSVDGVTVMKYNGDITTSGSYSRFGANHGDHSATIGVIVHELGHAMLHLRDFYDDGGGSGLGWYDIMSGGGWAYKDTDTYAGETPTQFSTYNKALSGITMNAYTINTPQTLTLKCSSNDFIKLETSIADEYFLIECRDTEKVNSDISLSNTYNGGFSPNDNANFNNRLFSIIYHVDDSKSTNTQSGTQTATNHYNISVLEKDTTHLMTSTESIEADYNDVFIEGEILDNTRTKLYDGTVTNYAIEIVDADYTTRTMTIKITK